MHVMKKKENMLMLGMFSLLIAFVLGRFESQYRLIDFFEGMFTGISMAMNLTFLVKFRIERGINDQITET